MKVKELLDRYTELARVHASIDYGDPRSVRRANKAVDEMISISRDVSQMGQQGLEAFATLLDVSTNKTDLWAAHHIIDYMDYSEMLKQRALAIIRENAKGESLNALGERWWLKNWEETHKA